MIDAVFEFEFRGQRYRDAERGLEAFGRHLGRAPNTATEPLKKELRKFLVWVADDVARRNSGKWPGGTTSNSLSSRSGRTAAAIRSSPRVMGSTLNNVQGSVGGPFYLRSHEFGAVIKPKRAKYLTIPLPAALNSNGTPKKARARQWDRTFLMTSKKGNLLICRKDGRRVVPLYVLKKQVRIPARLGFRSSLARQVPRFSDWAMARMAERMVRGK